ncbi:nuclear receptor-interacting protein 3 isoform X2 [Xenopus laevis]|uniref:Nuclear receptor-interacting protein 3 isoform X2 n=1 Tax=Xenopus laevis TaxID=8355 RepID=A0A8J1KL58_XENLA|nr:nuclear receptor-interacting protein 3 isoform X2 [Xenopus laevis]
MFYSGILTESSRKEADPREAATIRQQRRMKQAVQFIHKDSADLLPLDGMKKLGTSKDTPHNILQRRLLETNLSKLRINRPTWTPKNDKLAQSKKLNQGKLESPRKSEEEDMIYIWCQCAGKEVRALIDTACQYSLIPAPCLHRLGLKEHFRSYKKEEERPSLPYDVKAIGQVERMEVMLGGSTVECTAIVIDNNDRNFSLGLQTLKSLKCVINLEKNHIEVGQTDKDIIPFISNRNTVKEDHSSEGVTGKRRDSPANDQKVPLVSA